MPLFNLIARRLIQITNTRAPDFVVGEPARPYLHRWFLIPRNPFFNVYLHKFLRDDDDRALHDHPWPSLSIVLKGAYCEITSSGRFNRVKGDLIFRRPATAHRIELFHWCTETLHAYTLFITGPRIREWGFHCPRGWVHWRAFTAPGDEGQIGRGCGEMS